MNYFLCVIVWKYTCKRFEGLMTLKASRSFPELSLQWTRFFSVLTFELYQLLTEGLVDWISIRILSSGSTLTTVVEVVVFRRELLDSACRVSSCCCWTGAVETVEHLGMRSMGCMYLSLDKTAGGCGFKPWLTRNIGLPCWQWDRAPLFTAGSLFRMDSGFLLLFAIKNKKENSWFSLVLIKH